MENRVVVRCSESPFSRAFVGARSFCMYMATWESAAKREHCCKVSGYRALESKLPDDSSSSRVAPRVASRRTARWSATRAGSMVVKDALVTPGGPGLGAGGDTTSIVGVFPSRSGRRSRLRRDGCHVFEDGFRICVLSGNRVGRVGIKIG